MVHRGTPVGVARSRVVRTAVPFMFFALLTMLIAYPILFYTGTHTAGYDYFSFQWNFWWMRHALGTPGQPLYLSNHVLFPFTNNLAYHSLAPAWYPLWAALEPAIGTLAAVTVIIALACTLNGYVTYLFLRGEGVHVALALISGAAMQLLPTMRYFVYNTHLNLLGWFWLPLHLMLWRKIAQAVECRDQQHVMLLIALQGVGLWALILTDQQLPLFLALLLGPYALATLLRPGRQRRAQIVAAGLLASAIGAALAWVAGPLPYLTGSGGGFAAGSVEVRPGIPFPDGFVRMADPWWQWNQPSMGGFITAAVLLSVVAALARRRARRCWFWFAVMLPPLIIALGPTLRIGALEIPLPYRAVYQLSGGLFAMPWRLAPVVALAGLTFAGLTWTPLMHRLPVRRVLPILVALLLAMGLDLRLGESAPLDPVPPDYTFYDEMGREDCEGCADYVVLEVPTAAGTGEVLVGDPKAVALQYYVAAHGKRVVNGFLARAPVERFWWLRDQDPMMGWLGQRRLLEPQAVADQLRERIWGWPIGYAVIHADLIGRDGPTLQEILAFFNAHDDLMCPYTVEGAAIVYRTRWHPLGCVPRTPAQTAPDSYRVDIGSPGDDRFIGSGWHQQERIFDTTVRWMGQTTDQTAETQLTSPRTQLWIDLPPRNYLLRLAVQSFHEARRMRVRVGSVLLDGEAIIKPDALREATFTIPAAALGSGQHVEVVFLFDGQIVPAEIGQSADPRPLAAMVDWMAFEGR